MMSMISSRRRSIYRVLVGKAEGKRPLGRPRHRSSSFGTTTLCGFLPSQPSLSQFFYP